MELSAEVRRTPVGLVIGIAGGVLLAVGSLMTWFTLSGQGLGKSVSGIDGWEGRTTLALGIVVLASCAASLNGTRRAVALVAILGGIVGATIGVYEVFTVRDQIAEERAAETGVTMEQARATVDQLIETGELDLSRGVGLYFVICGGALGIFGGVLLAAAGGPRSPAMQMEAPAPVGSPPVPALTSLSGNPPPPPPPPPDPPPS